MSRVQTVVKRLNVSNPERLQPSLGVHPPEGMVPRTLRVAHFSRAIEQAHEIVPVAFLEYSLLGAHAEDNFRSAGE